MNQQISYNDLILNTVNGIQDFYIWVDKKGSIINCNPSVEQELGYTKEDLLKKKIYDVYSGVKSGEWESFWTRVQEQKSLSEIALFVNKQQERLTFRTLVSPVPNLNGDACLSFILRKTSIDLTKNTGDKDSQEFLKNIINNVGDPIMVKDEQHRWVFMSNETIKAIGMKWEDLEGKSDHDIFPKEEADEFWKKDDEVLTTGKENINEESFTSADGKKITILTTKRLYVDRGGNKFIVGISKDISEIKEVREQLKKHNEELEEKVKERTAELQMANNDMEIRIDQLKYLNDKGHFFAQLIDRDALLSAIFYAFVERFPGGQVHIVEGFGKLRSLYSTRGLRKKAITEGCLEALELIDWKQLKEINMEKCWYENSILSRCFDESLKSIPCYVVIPFITNNIVRGVIQIFAREEFAGEFKREEPLLKSLATQAAVALDNAYHYKELGQRARIQSELEIAQGIQKRYVPRDPEIQGFNLRGVCMPANEVGGDYLDYFQNIEGDWVIAIADVCGKGIPAALVMTSLRSTLRTVGKYARSSKDLLVQVNNFIGKELQDDNSFITCMCIIIHHNGTEMNFARAGHPRLISYNGSGNQVDSIPGKGVALGMLVGRDFEDVLEEITLPIKKGDRFIAYTDGLDEAMNPEKKFYGTKRLMDLLDNSRSEAPVEIINTIQKDVKKFVSGQQQYDDLTLLAMEKI